MPLLILEWFPLSENHDVDTYRKFDKYSIIQNSLYPLNTLGLVNLIIIFAISNRNQKHCMPIPVNIVTKAKVKTEFLYIYKFNVVFFRLFKSSSKWSPQWLTNWISVCNNMLLLFPEYLKPNSHIGVPTHCFFVVIVGVHLRCVFFF